MKMPRSSEAMVSRFAELVPVDERIVRKQMFGYPCAVVGGNMFMSLHGDDLVLRLPEDKIAELLKIEGCAPFEAMQGRVMRGYLRVEGSLAKDDERVGEWAQAAFEHAAALPAKQRAPRKSARNSFPHCAHA